MISRRTFFGQSALLTAAALLPAIPAPAGKEVDIYGYKVWRASIPKGPVGCRWKSSVCVGPTWWEESTQENCIEHRPSVLKHLRNEEAELTFGCIYPNWTTRPDVDCMRVTTNTPFTDKSVETMRWIFETASPWGTGRSLKAIIISRDMARSLVTFPQSEYVEQDLDFLCHMREVKDPTWALFSGCIYRFWKRTGLRLHVRNDDEPVIELIG